jgi:hypothetical protein
VIERPDAQALMAGPLGTWLAGQSEARATAKAKSRKYTFYGVVAGASLGLFVLILFRDIEAGLGVGFGCFAIGSAFAYQARKEVTDRIKGQINGEIARALQVDYAMAVADRSLFERARAFDLFPSHDDESFEDEWCDLVREPSLRLHEVKLTEEQGSGKSRRTVTVFRGPILSVGFARKFIGTTLITRENRYRSFFGFQKDKITVGGVEMSRVSLVDPRFEDTFTIWSDDGVEAHYLVHPEYAERLLAVESAYRGKNLRALFHGGELLIVIETDDQFESGSLEACHDMRLLEATIEQFTSLVVLGHRLNERPRAGFN